MHTTSRSSYKNLIVYQKAKQLTIGLAKHLSKNKYPRIYEFVVIQLLRSASSIAANIAEGYGNITLKAIDTF